MSVQDFIANLESRPDAPVTNGVLAKALRLVCRCSGEVCDVGGAVSGENEKPEMRDTVLQSGQTGEGVVPMEGQIPVQEHQQNNEATIGDIGKAEGYDRSATQVDSGNVQSVQDEMSHLSQQLTERDDQIKQLKDQLECLNREKQEEARRAKDSEQALANIRGEKEELAQQLRDIDTQIGDLNTRITGKDKEIGELSNQLSTSEIDRKAATDRAERTERELSEMKEERERLSYQIRQEKEEVVGLEREVERLSGELGEMRTEKEKYVQQVSECNEQIGKLNNRLSASESGKEEERKRVDHLGEELAKAQAERDSAEDRMERYQNFLQRIWPEAIRVEELEEFKAEWEAEILAASPNEDLLFMFANIFTWSSAYSIEESGKGDDATELTAITGLFNFSKALFRWLTNHGYDYEHAFRIFVSLAEKINARMSGGKYRIEVPTLDSPYSSKSMTTLSPSSLGSVEAVEAWGIQSTTSNTYKRKSFVKLTD